MGNMTETPSTLPSRQVWLRLQVNELTVWSALQVAPSNLQGAHKPKQLLLRCSVVNFGNSENLLKNNMEEILKEIRMSSAPTAPTVPRNSSVSCA